MPHFNKYLWVSLFANRKSLSGNGFIKRQWLHEPSIVRTAYSRHSLHSDLVEILHGAWVPGCAPACHCYLSTWSSVCYFYRNIDYLKVDFQICWKFTTATKDKCSLKFWIILEDPALRQYYTLYSCLHLFKTEVMKTITWAEQYFVLYPKVVENHENTVISFTELMTKCFEAGSYSRATKTIHYFINHITILLII